VALDYARLPREGRPAYTDYLAGRTVGAAPKEGDIAAEAKGRPALVIVSRAGCKECEELEREGLNRPEVAQLLRGFAVVRRDLSGAWARANRITYTPSLVYLDAGGKEAFRTEGYLRPFHLAASVDYVASGAYRSEPSFQRYLQARADRMRAEGKTVDLWK
jgi:thioredoxin-related protein